MNSLLLSKITKDYLSREFVGRRERYRAGWAGSVLAPHPRATELISSRDRLATLFDQPIAIAAPRKPAPATFLPPQYFFKGAGETDRKKNPAPIFYLLTETHETSQARPVPGNSLLLRSLCRGKGVLRKNNQGMIYLDVNNRFILTLLPFLKAYGLVRPPYFNFFTIPDGAHVPVIPAREMAFQYLDEIQELSQEFAFEIEGLYSMEPTSWPEVEQVWFFKLHSPELEKLRRRYFLPAIPGGHAFHIAIAVKMRVKQADAPQPLPLMRINTAFTAA